MSDENPKLWNQAIPWFLTVTSTITLIVIGFFLWSNVEWFKMHAFNSELAKTNTEYSIYIYQLHLSMIKRAVGLFCGFCLAFIGLAVSFYTLKSETKGEMSAPGLSANIASASVGIITVFVGGYIIISTINSKDIFPGVNQSNMSEQLYIPPKP